MSIESQLLDLGHWPIRSIQAIGYLPLSIHNPSKRVQDSSLRFKLKSCLVLFPILFLLTTTVFMSVYFYNFQQYLRYLKVFSATEKYAHTVFVIVTNLVGIYFRITGLWERGTTLSFWRDNCNTLERVQALLGYFKWDLLQELEFQRIRRSLKMIVLATGAIAVIHTVLVHGYRTLKSYRIQTENGRGFVIKPELHLGLAYGSFLILFHVVNTVWISFFIQIYTAGFSCIGRKIQKLGENCKYPRLNSLIDNGLDVSAIPGLSFEKPGAGPSSSLKLSRSQLQQCVEAFIILEKQVQRFNDFFGGKLIVEILICIIGLVVNLFFISIWMGRGNMAEILPISGYILVNANQLHSLGMVAGEMTLAAKTVATACFETVPNGQLSSEMQIKLEMLCSKIGRNPPIISARHFFTVNRHLVTSVLSAMTTFLVVLVQFKDADYNDFLRLDLDRNETLKILG